ncbi:MAG: hypothetical protein IJY04_01290, partial [Clostridia bacterium]|nr:hypothetical protein [Clostridia bacterium]
MYSIDDLAKYIADTLNAQLTAEEQVTSPFRIYTDIGDLTKAYRNGNTVYKKRFGVCTVSSSNVTPLGTLMVYNASATVEILVNVDAMDYEGDVGEYAPVKEMRRIIDNVAATISGQPSNVEVDGVTYSVVPVYTLSNTGAFSVEATELGKMVPLSFNVALNVVERGINSSNIVVTVGGQRV